MRTSGFRVIDGSLLLRASARETASVLLEAGLWPVPITAADDPRSPSPGKAPIGRGWGLNRPSPGALGEVYRRNPKAGVGLLLGPAGGVIDVEIDDPSAAGPLLDRLFQDVPGTLGWRSARGGHRLFAWDERLAGMARSAVVTLAGGALELRLGGRGKQVVSVCPPSRGADGLARVWNGVWETSPLPESVIRLAEGEGRPRAARPPRRGARRVGTDVGRYGAAALAREAEIVRSAEPGTRNSTLNRAAFNLGQLVAGGLLARAAVEEELMDAGLASGLTDGEVRATLQSGLRAGQLRPRRCAVPS